MMIIQRGSLRTKNKTCSKEYSLREYKRKALIFSAFLFYLSKTLHLQVTNEAKKRDICTRNVFQMFSKKLTILE